MYKKYLSLFLVAALLFSLAACGNSKDADTTTDGGQTTIAAAGEGSDVTTKGDGGSDSGVLVVGESIEKGDRGSGPVVIESTLSIVSIPEGLDYELYNAYDNSVRVDFGAGNTGAGHIAFSTTRMIKSLDDAANECVRTNDFTGSLESEIGEEVTYGDLTYKAVNIWKPDEGDTKGHTEHFLAAYYTTAAGKDAYVEVRANGEGNYRNIEIDNPLIVEILNTLKLK
ncbi:MAG TPA: hypothetical protein VFD23_04840 [Clostridia bacterium]|nr:hypothetical protein [Clostridia bacterium]